MEHIEQVCSLEYKLLVMSICSIRIPSRDWDIVEKPLHNPFVSDIIHYNDNNIDFTVVWGGLKRI